MESIYTYTTPSFTLKFKTQGVLEGYDKVVVTLYQEGVAIVIKNTEDLSIDEEQNTIDVSFTQEDTGKLVGGYKDDPYYALIQANVLFENESRNASGTAEIEVYKNTYREVMNND